MGSAASIIERFLQAQDRLVVQASDFSLETIANMVDQEAIDIQPKYQRRERWSAAQQSALIESFLLNIPVPPVYLSEDDFGTYSVIDGKQRITAIRNYMRNGYALQKLQEFTEIEGMVFSELPRQLKNSLQVRPYLRVITLLKQSDPDLKYEVFTRLNRGGEQLNAQEIRNAAFRGPLNDLIYQLSEHRFLRQQLKIRNEKSAAYQSMTDAEYVLRFFTLFESWRDFTGDYRESMDRFMLSHSNLNKNELANLEDLFVRSLEGCEEIWEHNAFRRPVDIGWRDQTLAGMYDAQMIAVAQFSKEEIKRISLKRLEINKATRELFEDEEFETAVRIGTNTPSRVVYRVTEMQSLLEKYK